LIPLTLSKSELKETISDIFEVFIISTDTESVKERVPSYFNI
jgi:hypothetical protein